MNESMEAASIDQGELDAAWAEDGLTADQPEGDEGTPAQSGGTGQLPQGGSLLDGGGGRALDEGDGPPRGAGTTSLPEDETFSLKHLGEVHTVGREEAVRLAQQGMDYERVRTERDQLRSYREEADPALNLVKSYAERNGMPVADYLDFCRKQELMAQGVNEQTATAQIAVEKGQAQLQAQNAEIETQRQQQNDMARQAQERAETRKRDMTAFLEAYPGVKGEEIPKEVWEQVSKGQSLVNAYTMHQNRQLQAELAAERQNKQNQQLSTGSLSNPADGDKNDIDRWWNDDE